MVVVAHGRSRNAGGGHSCCRIRAIYEEISVILSFLCYHGSKQGDGGMHGDGDL